MRVQNFGFLSSKEFCNKWLYQHSDKPNKIHCKWHKYTTLTILIQTIYLDTVISVSYVKRRHIYTFQQQKEHKLYDTVAPKV